MTSTQGDVARRRPVCVHARLGGSSLELAVRGVPVLGAGREDRSLPLERGSAVLGFEAAAALRPAPSVRAVRSVFVRTVTVVGAVVAALALAAPGSAAAAPSAAVTVTP